MADSAEKNVSFLQYINTGLLTLILTVVSIGASTMVKFNKEVSDVKTEQVRLKTIQDNTVMVSSELVVRVNALEVGYVDQIKTWVDANYVRKSQK